MAPVIHEVDPRAQGATSRVPVGRTGGGPFMGFLRLGALFGRPRLDVYVIRQRLPFPLIKR